MVAYGEHSSTSMAVKAVIEYLKQHLSTRFDFLAGMPDLFYDINRGVSDQFKQRYAKIPERDRDYNWISLAYSYDAYEESVVQPRKGLTWSRPVTDNLKRKINVNYVQLPLLISILCNDSKTFNALHNFISARFDWSFTTTYKDMLWPEWKPDLAMPAGWYIRPTKPNNHVYMCTKAGKTSSTEPEWSDVQGDITQDNEAQWTCLPIDELKVKAGSFVKNNSAITNPIEGGIMYQLDFGFTLHYTDYDDAGELIGVIEEVELDLLSMYDAIYAKLRAGKAD